MKKASKIMWGIVLIAIGCILAGNALGWFDVNIFFNGWWTLFIIVPSLIGLINDDNKTGSIIGLVIGVALLLSCRGIFSFDIIWKLLLPAVIVIIGLSMIFKEVFNKESSETIKKLNEKLNSKDGYTATFSGQDLFIDGEEFKGTNLNAIFGGIKLDLRKAIINEDVVINTSSVFGGIDIFVPDGYKVKVKSNSIFGGVSNSKKSDVAEDAHTIYVNATCVFGGLEVK